MKSSIYLFVILVLVSGGCATTRRSARETCEEQQAMIWDAAASQFLSDPVRSGQMVDPGKMGSLFRGGKVPKCPSGKEDYKPFNLLEGPRCPNEPVAHAVKEIPDRVDILREAFRKKSKP